MPPRKRQPAPTTQAAIVATTPDHSGRKITRTITVITTQGAAQSLANRAEQDLTQAPHTFEVERVAGPRDTNPRWRFNIPGPMLVVAENDLRLIQALMLQLGWETTS